MLRLAPVLLVALVASTGCLSPFLKRASDAPEPKPSDALVAGLVVRFDSGSEEKSMLGAAIDAAQNAQLETFGKRATEMLASKLAEHGYTAVYDGPRSSKLDAIRCSTCKASARGTARCSSPIARRATSRPR